MVNRGMHLESLFWHFDGLFWHLEGLFLVLVGLQCPDCCAFVFCGLVHLQACEGVSPATLQGNGTRVASKHKLTTCCLLFYYRYHWYYHYHML